LSLAAKYNAQRNPDLWAVRDERLCLSWSQLDEVLNRATNALSSAKRSERGRLAVVSSNCVEIAVAHIAGLQAGISTVPINPKLTPAELLYILQDADVEIVFADAGALELAKSALSMLPDLKIVAWRSPPATDVIAWEDWLAGSSGAEPPTSMPPRPHVIYTSGTTGKPKGVETPPTMFPEAATVAELFAKFKEMQHRLDDISPALIISPLYHTAPMTLVRSFAGGSQLAILSKFDAENILAAIDKFRVQRVGMVPTHFHRLLELPAQIRAQYDLSSLRMVTHTGAACPRATKQAMIDWVGPILRETYGGSESGPTNRIACDEWQRKPGSVGKACEPFELLILDDNHSPLPAGKEGRIYFRDKTGRGIRYYKDPQKTATAHIRPGVFTLGDIGYCDVEGFLFITDRAADMILSGGVNVYPAEAEQRLVTHAQVKDVAVIGVPSKDMGEEVKALVVPRDLDNPPAAKDLDAFCRAALAPYKCPRSYEFVADIGRNLLGKVNKKELRSRYWEGRRTIGG
jgi:long-chain acyl-CoA synthetase